MKNNTTKKIIYRTDIRNIKKSCEYIYNSYKRKIHIRTNITNNNNSIVIFLHGYAAHANRPPNKYLGDLLNKNNIGIVTIDFSGHGYSDNIDNTKCYIPSYKYLLDDVICVINELYNYNNNNILNDNNIRNKITKQQNIYILGHSMGGAIGMLLANILSNNINFNNINITDKIKKSFRGLILLSPALGLNIPKWLNYIIKPIANILPKTFISDKIIDPNMYNKYIYLDQKYIEYICNDSHNNKGISYGNNIRFITLKSIIEMTEEINKIINDINYPIMIIYDKNNDIIISIDKIEIIKNNKKIINKEIINIIDGLHDPLANKMKEVSEKICNWIIRQK
jgi:alpha-beta hydrolase superfamily lysophospholipase